MPNDSPMRIKIGAPATGCDFYPRNDVIERLVRALQNEHVLFLAPRRTGKTSVLLRMQQRVEARLVFINLEGFNHPSLWIRAMAKELSEIRDPVWQQKLKKAGDIVKRLKSRHLEITESDWQDKADGLLRDLNDLDEPLWFLLDEFPIMIDKIAKKHGAHEASATLHWLRQTRQQNPDSAVRFLLTGSIGLDSVLRRHGIRGPANDLRREELQPMRADEALGFALRLARDNGIPLNENLAREYIARLGPAIWAYFIQLFVAELQERNPNPANPIDLLEIYSAVAHGKRNQYADNMWERLAEIFNETEASTARAILKRIAAGENGIPLEQLRAQLPQLEDKDFAYVLDVLRHDGYSIESNDARMRFFSHLLRDYWRRKGRV